MAGLRFQIILDGFIPEDPTGTLVAGVKIATAVAHKIPAIRAEVQDVKAFVANMNRTLRGEELSLKATYHQCFHDETTPKPCGIEQEI